jgi:hypothetical protein
MFKENFYMVSDHAINLQNHPVLCYHNNITWLSYCSWNCYGTSHKQKFLQWYLDFDSQGIIYGLIFNMLIYILYDCFVLHSG